MSVDQIRRDTGDLASRAHPKARSRIFPIGVVFALIFLTTFAVAAFFLFPGKSADRLELLTLLQQQDYAALEKELTRYQNRFEAGTTSDLAVEQAFEAFASADPELETWLDKWVRGHPESWNAVLARSVYYLHLAEIVRGARIERAPIRPYKKKVADYLALAIADAATARSRNDELSVAYGIAIRAAMLGDDEDQARHVLERGLSTMPSSHVIPGRFLEHLRHDSNDLSTDVLAFFRKAREALPTAADLGSLNGYNEFLEAEKLRQEDRYREAIRHYDAALEYGEDPVYRIGRAENFYEASLFERGLEDLDRLLIVWPHVPEFLAARARFNEALNRHPDDLFPRIRVMRQESSP